MQIQGHDIAVCSWSLLPKDMAELVRMVGELDLTHVQLGMLELVMLDDKRKHQELGHLRGAGITITSGMMSFPGEDYSTIAMIRKTGGFVPDETWDIRKQLMLQGAKLCVELGVKKLSTHIGFVPPSSDETYRVMVQRTCELAKPMADMGVDLLMETGQEPANELLQFLNDLHCRNVYINFDPANMILYGAGDPIEAISTLGRYITHVHVKDAVLSPRPGEEWGEEVPFGKGQIAPKEFLEALENAGYRGALAIEREAGNDRMEDVKFAIETLQKAGQ